MLHNAHLSEFLRRLTGITGTPENLSNIVFKRDEDGMKLSRGIWMITGTEGRYVHFREIGKWKSIRWATTLEAASILINKISYKRSGRGNYTIVHLGERCDGWGRSAT